MWKSIIIGNQAHVNQEIKNTSTYAYRRMNVEKYTHFRYVMSIKIQ